MISDCIQDLISKIKTLNDYGTTVRRVGAAAGGKTMDPTMTKVDTPAAWVIFVGDENIDTDTNGVCGPTVRLNFIVKVIIDYSTETDLISSQYPVLVNTINAVSGQNGPAGSRKWRYEGQTLDEMSGNRLIFDQRFSITSVL